MADMKEILSTILFKGNPDYNGYILPLTGSWFAPTINTSDKISTWIGYVIMETKLELRSMTSNAGYGSIKVVRSKIRLSFNGPQAEDFANSTLFWDERKDIKKVFEKYQAQLMYSQRKVSTHISRQDGFNDRLYWITDLEIIHYVTDMTEDKEYWFTPCPCEAGVKVE
jgi:hypothetical protein